MHKALQLAALAAGTLASPQGGNFRGGHGWNGPPTEWVQSHAGSALASVLGGAPQSWQQSGADWHGQGGRPTAAAAASAAGSSASGSTATVFKSVDVTVTSCAPSSSACSASLSKSSAASSAASSVTAAAVSGSSVSVSSVSGSSVSLSSSVTPYASLSLATYSSTSAKAGTGSASGASSGAVTGATSSGSASGSASGTSAALVSHTISAVTALVPTATTTVVASSATDCPLLPTSPITNSKQVGKSLLGTLCEPYLPQWLGDYTTAPWGNLTTKNSDATVKGDIPITNVTRYYEFVISRGQISPDGVLRDVILINGQFPGPQIEANWGDWIEVKVTNNITNPYEGTSIHWHGVLQKGTPWMDGVPGTGQCPIAPGHSLTYNFIAELHGTSWYHAHFSAQFTAGIAGPIVVHGPSALPHDIDVGPVMLSDWYHIPYFSIVMDAVGKNFSVIPPVSDSVLINGRGNFNCSNPSYSSDSDWLSSNLKSNITWTCVDDAPLSSFRFQSGKTHRLRLINMGANGIQRFSIDNHNMTVISTDYVPTMPYDTDVVTLGVGQRTDVIVTALNTPKAAIWMRTQALGGQPCGAAANPETLAAIYYENADVTKYPTTKQTATFNATDCSNDALTVTTPEYTILPSNDSWIQDLSLTLELNATGHFEFMVNGQAAHMDVNVPLLDHAAKGNLTFEPQWNVYNFHKNTSIILNITNNMPLAHPWHFHGHNFYVLNVGSKAGPVFANGPGPNGGPGFQSGAVWDGSVIKPENPMRRDTQIIPPYGFAALQFELDNPGVWPFHCHIAWHLSAGQVLNILYRDQDIVPLPSDWVADSCVDWNYFSDRNVVDQIDAGA